MDRWTDRQGYSYILQNIVEVFKHFQYYNIATDTWQEKMLSVCNFVVMVMMDDNLKQNKKQITHNKE